MDSDAAAISRVSSEVGWRELAGAICIRLGIGRNSYRVKPGLYALGNPDKESPVLVTANYKLTFDHLRGHLDGADAWILVLDTRGINVWCAAGKGTFSTDEVIKRIKGSNLDQVVSHRRIILPQLSATGVVAHEIQKATGFKAIYGPIRASDIKDYLGNGMKASDEMRGVTFTLAERLILTPLEVLSMWKPSSILIVLFIFVTSGAGIGPYFFCPEAALIRGAMACSAILSGLILGAFVTPILLPWIPARAFSLKGFLTGIVAAALVAPFLFSIMNGYELSSLIIIEATASSFFAMNFTGSTPFTSPSGVEKEMRIAMPLQLLGLVTAITLWVWSAFI